MVVSLKVRRRMAPVLVACALVVVTSLLLAAAGCDELSPAGARSPAEATPVYVTIYSHNEDTWEPYVKDESRYREYRANLLEKLQLLVQYGAKLDWQSDITVLQGMLEYEQGELLAGTGGKNIVRYMAEDLGFSVDPHGHLSECNYADLAYLIEQLGAPTPTVIGGCRLFELGGDYLGFLNVLDWREQIELGDDGVIHGRIYPEATWAPTILSVPAIAGHWCDELSSGVWRPGPGTDFFTDDPNGSIVYAGQGYPHSQANLGPEQASGADVAQEGVEYIEELVARIESGELPAGQMYTASLHVRDLPVVNDSGTGVDTLEGLRTILETLKPLHDSGKIVYVTYPEAVEVWRSRYGAEANRVAFEGFSMCEDVLAQAMRKAGVKPAAASGGPAGTSPGADDTAGAATAAAAASAEAVEYDASTLQVDTRVPCAACGSQGVLVRLHLPKSGADARYSDTGAPVVVAVPGGLDNKPVIGGASVSRYFATGLGMVTVYFNLPGSGVAPYDTGGTYDQRGPVCQEVLRDVLLFALGKKADADGDLISDLIPYADLDNVGVIGLSNGGNLAGVTMDKYSSQLEGLRYYVSYENPAGDEYIVTDLGGPKGTNPAYTRGATVLDPVDGSVSTLDASRLAFEIRTATPYFDLNGNGALDLGSDYACTYWESGGKRYYSTEIVSMLVDKGLVRFPSPKIADLPSTEAFWEERDMSRHTTAAVPAIHSLQGAILVATEKDHVQNEPGYPHIVVNYLGWSGLPFVRINPDEVYVESVLAGAGPGGRGAPGAGPRTVADNPAGAAVDFTSIDSMLEPEGLVDEIFDLATILELADRVHYDVWTADLAAVLE